MRLTVYLALIAVIALAAAGCSKVVVDHKGLLEDGGKLEFPLDRGTYEVALAATGDGASVEWRGGDCPGTGPVKKWTSRCRLASPGKLVVRNPSVLHLGSDARITLKVTKVPR